MIWVQFLTKIINQQIRNTQVYKLSQANKKIYILFVLCLFTDCLRQFITFVLKFTNVVIN